MAHSHTDIDIDKNNIQKRIFFLSRETKATWETVLRLLAVVLGASFRGVQEEGKLVAEGFRLGSFLF